MVDENRADFRVETTACLGCSLKWSSTMKQIPSKCLALKKKSNIMFRFLSGTFGTDEVKSVSNSFFSYSFRPWIHRQSFDSCTSISSTLPLNSAVLVQLFAVSPWIKLGNWSQLKINQHFVLFFLRITFQPRSDPQSIVQLYKQLYQHKVPELLMVILVPKANVCIPSSPLISWLL